MHNGQVVSVDPCASFPKSVTVYRLSLVLTVCDRLRASRRPFSLPEGRIQRLQLNDLRKDDRNVILNLHEIQIIHYHIPQ
jgi:hypothetical protein